MPRGRMPAVGRTALCPTSQEWKLLTVLLTCAWVHVSIMASPGVADPASPLGDARSSDNLQSAEGSGIIDALQGLAMRRLQAAGHSSKKVAPSQFPPDTIFGKFTTVIMPGFCSTRLLSQTSYTCPGNLQSYAPKDPIWIQLTKALTGTNCWVKCMLLNGTTQGDIPDCWARPQEGLAANLDLDISALGILFTGVFAEFVNWMVGFKVKAQALVSAPYDWRLYPSMLEQRDQYFSRLRQKFETALEQNGPAVVFGHSLGNTVFRYFLAWLKQDLPDNEYQPWIDRNIYAYVGLGTHFLGAPGGPKAMLSGVTFGIPVDPKKFKIMGSTFGGVLWMYPVSPYCNRPSNWTRGKATYVCRQSARNASGWPTNLVTVKGIPGSNGPRSFSARDCADGTFHNALAGMDPDASLFAKKIVDWYHNDPSVNPLTAWERPPVKNVFCLYGVEQQTEVGYAYSPSNSSYPGNWNLDDVYYENAGGNLSSKSGARVYGNTFPTSGDDTIPYYSLSFCKSWLGTKVNITRAPFGRPYASTELQRLNNVAHVPGVPEGESGFLYPTNFNRTSGTNYITFYEDGNTKAGQRTAVWEVDQLSHRNMVQSVPLLREIWLELLYETFPNATRPFIRKDFRLPMTDEECTWDYRAVRCAWPQSCEFRYVTGDLTLDQSCRLKQQVDTAFFIHYAASLT